MSNILEKVPAFEKGYTFLMQPFGGHIYSFAEKPTESGIKRHHDVNQEGGAVLRKCTGLKTVQEIIDELCQEYEDVPTNVRPKVIEFLKTLEEKGYIRLYDSIYPTQGIIKGSTTYVTPMRAILEVTSACNLRCLHCYGDFTEPSPDEMSLHEQLEVLEDLHEMGTDGIDITGGEPLLRKKELFKIFEYCYDKFNFSLLTNATLVDDEFAKKFSQYDSTAQVSVYGCTAQDHEFVTKVPGSFKATMKGVQHLIRNGVRVTFAYLHRSGRLDHLGKMAGFCADAGASSFRISSLTPLGRGEHLDWDLPYSEFIQVSHIVEKIKKDYKGEMDVELWDTGGELSREELQQNRHLKCIVGSQLIVISSNGDFLPCGMMRWSLGNVKKASLKDILVSEGAQFFAYINAPSTLLCGDCTYLYACVKCHAQAALNYTKVEQCPWREQIKDAPAIILKNIKKEEK